MKSEAVFCSRAGLQSNVDEVLGPQGLRSMAHSKYRYVTRRVAGNKSRKPPGWYIQHLGKGIQGPYREEYQAAVAIAKILKVKVASLLRSKVKHVRGPNVTEDAAVSTYRYVTKHVIRGTTYWMAQPSRNRQKLFKDIKQAAAWSAMIRRVSMNSMLKGSKLHYRNQYQHRLAVVLRIYGQGSELPGDAAYLQSHAKAIGAIVKQEPAIEILDAQSKYGPSRDALAESWGSSLPWSKVRWSRVLRQYQPVSREDLRGLEIKYTAAKVHRAQHLLAVLRSTVQQVDGADFECWVTNCGRNVSHHSGFVPMLLRFEILQKVSKSTVPSLALGSTTGRRYQLRSDNLLAVLGKLCALIRLADAIEEKLPAVHGPRSCSAWSKAFQDLSQVVQDNPCPGMRDTTSYVPLWTMRALLLRRMWATGTRRLALDDSLWSDFAATFPDQKKMLSKVVVAETGLTCRNAMQRCKYKGPAELLTMYLCFLGTVDRTSTSFFIKHEAKLKKLRAIYKTDHLQNPVLLELLKIMKNGLKGSQVHG